MERLIDFISDSLAICCMVLLGFVEDVFNLRWKYKLVFPAISVLPLLMVYYSSNGCTFIVLPKLVRSYLCIDSCIELGVLYYLWMMALSIFCTNSINILAGINGLEAGQSILIAFFTLLNNLYNIFNERVPSLSYLERHLLSSFLLVPFLILS
jgi:UDP-N-acetylglucosamine--dolichyl-phosphate N-acetylglucosaminephosphotransferase